MSGIQLIGLASASEAVSNLSSDDKIKNILTKCANVGENKAKRDAPVDTGHLRSSIAVQWDDDKMGFYLGSGVRYAIFQELGTRYNRAHPYIRPAAQRIREFLHTLG